MLRIRLVYNNPFSVARLEVSVGPEWQSEGK